MTANGILTSGKKMVFSVLTAVLLIPFYAASANAGGSIQNIGSGPGWNESRFTLGDATHDVGTIEARFEVIINGQTTDGFQILTTILSIDPGAGWSADVKKDGGLDSPIEIRFTSEDGCQQRFKWLMVPGKTRGDFGQLKCK